MSKILIIEDDKFLRELMTQKLTSEGFEMIEASDGEMGVERVKEEEPDLVLLDLLLPGIDGFEVLKWIRQEKQFKDLPVIILSNLGDEKDIKKGKELGATSYLIKSNFTPTEIIETINRSLSG